MQICIKIFQNGDFMRLKELREERNLTQNEIAKAINVSQTNIGRWEKGLNEPTATGLIALAKYFNCSIDFLLECEDDIETTEIKTNLSYREQKLLRFFNLLEDDEKDKIIEDCEYFANKHIKTNQQRRA